MDLLAVEIEHCFRTKRSGQNTSVRVDAPEVVTREDVSGDALSSECCKGNINLPPSLASGVLPKREA